MSAYDKISAKLKSGELQVKLSNLGLNTDKITAGGSEIVYPLADKWNLLFQQRTAGEKSITLSFRIAGDEKFSTDITWKALYVYHSLKGDDKSQQIFNSREAWRGGNWNLQLFYQEESMSGQTLSQLNDKQLGEVAEWIVKQAGNLIYKHEQAFRECLKNVAGIKTINDIPEGEVKESVQQDIAKWYIANASNFTVHHDYTPDSAAIEAALEHMTTHMGTTANELRKKKQFEFTTTMNGATGNDDLTDYKAKRNLIFAGAPGTGKSFTLNREAKKLFTAENFIMRVTFHPEYTYYDFVGTYRPITAKKPSGEQEKSTIEYAFVPGPFAKMLKKALWQKKDKVNFCLIIEEINRANAAAVFGDVFQLLDRNDKGESEYAICPPAELADYLLEKEDGIEGEKPDDSLKQALSLPDNLYLWATMNSADQGCFPMDTAFKRRWSFKNMKLNPTEIEDKGKSWNAIRKGINELLLDHHVPEDKLMGYYFLKKEERTNALEEALKNKVMLYLFEDAAKPFRNSIFKKEFRTCGMLREGLKLATKEDLAVFQKKIWDAEGRLIEDKDPDNKY